MSQLVRYPRPQTLPADLLQKARDVASGEPIGRKRTWLFLAIHAHSSVQALRVDPAETWNRCSACPVDVWTARMDRPVDSSLMFHDGRWFWWLVGVCTLVVGVSFVGIGPFADSETPRETELLVDHGPRLTSTTTSSSSTTTAPSTSTTLPSTTTSVTTTTVPDAGPSPEDVAAYLDALSTMSTTTTAPPPPTTTTTTAPTTTAVPTTTTTTTPSSTTTTRPRATTTTTTRPTTTTAP